MKGLVEEGQEHMEEDLEKHLLDAAIIGSAQKVEHYEIAGYGTARALANMLGRKDAAQLLQETLDEEGATDKKLTVIAKTLLKEAVRSESSRGGAEMENGGARRQRSGNGTRSRSAGQSARGQSSRSQTSRSQSSRSQTSRSRTAKTSGGRNTAAKTSRSRGNGGSSQTTTDHEEIRRWAEERGGKPACVKGTGGRGDTGMIRIDFPGYSGGESLQQITWDEFFEKFDDNKLALLHQEKTVSGQKSNFNKLVKRAR